MTVVDVHAHVIPPALVARMRAGTLADGVRLEDGGDGPPWVVHRQGYRYPLLPEFHDVAARLAVMDATGVDRALVSVAPPFFAYWVDGAEGVDAARTANEAVLAMTAQAPDRLSPVATLPLQDPAAAVEELRWCAAAGFVAAQVGPHCEGVPLDDPRLLPVLATAAQLGVPLVLHPYYVGSAGGELADFYLTNLQGNPWQTAVAASRLILSGTLDALPGLDCVLVHGGGHLPYQAGRLDHGYRVRPEAQRPAQPPSAYLRRFHYDTLTHGPAATGFLVDQVGADRVMFGTDTPFDMGGGTLDAQLGGLVVGAEVAQVAHATATRLFRLDPTPEP